MATKSVMLTEKQKNHSLSGKKKKSKKSVRYSLAQPFPRYWPQLDEQQSNHLHQLLKNVQQKHPDWFTKQIPNESKFIFCGLQQSLRKLKNGQIKLLVLSADLKPRYVANQIILQALACNEDIRIVCVPNLANWTTSLFNFSCYAFVISNENWSELPELDRWTADLISTTFPLPSMMTTHLAKRKQNKLNCAMDVDESKTKLKRLQNSSEKCDDISDLHLFKHDTKTNQRAFVPQNGINMKPIALEIESLNKMKTDFISLATYNNSNDEASTFTSSHKQSGHKHSKKMNRRPLTLYRELTIHKIQNNPNKVKIFKNKNKNKNKNKTK